MKFEDKLIKLRKAKGLSQEELGNQINVSRQAVSKWESGQVKPEIEKVKELSQFFDVTTDYLIKEEIEENEPKIKKVNNKKKIFKITLFILLVIVILYLVTVIYKYAVLAMCVRKINNIEDYEEYEIYSTEVYNDKLENVVMKSLRNMKCKNGIYYTEVYTNSKVEKKGNDIYYEQSSNIKEFPDYIGFEDLNKEICYGLNYNYELGKYIYNNLKDENYETEDMGQIITIKDIAQIGFGDYFGIIGIAIDPRDKVRVNESYIEIQDKYKDGYINQTIDRENGFFIENLWVNDRVLMSVSYEYMLGEIDDFEVQEPKVEYIMADEIYEE